MQMAKIRGTGSHGEIWWLTHNETWVSDEAYSADFAPNYAHKVVSRINIFSAQLDPEDRIAAEVVE